MVGRREGRAGAASGPQARAVAAVVVAPEPAADSMGDCRGGSSPSTARCRGAFLVGGRTGVAAGGNFRLAAPGQGTVVGGRRCRFAHSAPALAVAPRRGWRLRPARRSRREAARARAASGERGVRVPQSPARSWFPLGLSSRDLSAMRHRGRSLLFLLRRSCYVPWPFSSINYGTAWSLDATVRGRLRLPPANSADPPCGSFPARCGRHLRSTQQAVEAVDRCPSPECRVVRPTSARHSAEMAFGFAVPKVWRG